MKSKLIVSSIENVEADVDAFLSSDVVAEVISVNHAISKKPIRIIDSDSVCISKYTVSVLIVYKPKQDVVEHWDD